MAPSQTSICLVRFTKDGFVDTTFNAADTSGYITTLIGSQASTNSITLQDDQKIVVAGQATVNDINQIMVARYTPQGTIDTTFDPLGYVTTEVGSNAEAYGVVIQPDRKIVVAGFGTPSDASQIAIVRYLGNVLPAQAAAATLPIQTIINTYASNSANVPQFLYLNYFALAITDSAARAAAISGIESMLATYISAYATQAGFSFGANLYLITAQLDTLEADLIATYPESTTQIQTFFTNLEARMASLVTTA